MADPKRTGGCMCGRITYEARGAPKRVGVCHCTICQRNSGSAFMVFAVYPETEVTLSREPAHHVALSGKRMFCPDCGATLGFRDVPGEIDLTLGSFDAPPGFEVDYELWIGHRMPWQHPVEGARQHPAGRDSEPV